MVMKYAFETQDVQRSTLLFRYICLLILKRNHFGCIYQRHTIKWQNTIKEDLLEALTDGITDHISYIKI